MKLLNLSVCQHYFHHEALTNLIVSVYIKSYLILCIGANTDTVSGCSV